MRYSDIIDHPHHESVKHERMPRLDRAAQFAPFAALTGYEDSIEEAGRVIESRVQLGKEGIDELDSRLKELYVSSDFTEAEITYFSESEGRYEIAKGLISRIDRANKKLVFSDGKQISFEDILKITINNTDNGI